MPADRPLKSRRKRASATAATARPTPPRLSIQMDFRLPEWEGLPTTLEEGTTRHRLWWRLSERVALECSHQESAETGILRLEVDLPSDPQNPDDFPEQSIPGLAQRIADAISGRPLSGGDRPFPLRLRPFAELGDVLAAGQFLPGSVYKESLDDGGEPAHTADQDATDEAGTPVTEGSPISPPPAETRPKYLDALLATRPDAPYEEQAQQRETLKHAFNQKLAAIQGEALKAEMLRRGKLAKTYVEKSTIVHWANGELRRFGLAFSTAKTGVGRLTADNAVLEGRFVVKGKAKDEDDKTPVLHTKYISELVNSIEIVEAPPRREALAERIEREANTATVNRRRQ